MRALWNAAFYIVCVYWICKGVKIMFFDFFVTKKEHDKLMDAFTVVHFRYKELMKQWNTLVGQINARGGLAYLNKPPPAAITKEDVKILLQLCHPDKHQGRRIAQEMTTKLLAMREKL